MTRLIAKIDGCNLVPASASLCGGDRLDVVVRVERFMYVCPARPYMPAGRDQTTPPT